MQRLRALSLLVGLCALAGCATAPNPALVDAETAVAEIRSDEGVVRLAPLTVAEAQEILSRAQRAENEAEKTHRAQLSLLKAKTARANARRKNAENRAEELTQKALDLELDARARQAENALRKAEDAQRLAAQARQRAEEAQRCAGELREQAASERARIETTRSRTQTAEQRLRQVQQLLAELKPRLTSRGLVLTLGEVLFNFDSADLKLYTQRIMDQLANFLQENPMYAIRVEGHTDSEGTGTYNLQLSRARAQSVTDALLTRGIEGTRVSTEGFGERRPVASNETAAGRRENRRVEVILSQG